MTALDDLKQARAAYASQPGNAAVDPNWRSPTAFLDVAAGDVVQVDATFSANTGTDSSGFYWKIVPGGPVSAVVNVEPVFATGNRWGWYDLGTTALFVAGDSGQASFGIRIFEVDLDGKGDVVGLSIVAHVLGG